MPQKEYRVALVVDRSFGDRLVDLAERMHVWVCASTANRRAAEGIWAAKPEHSLESGVTTFNVAADHTPGHICIAILDQVDLHHGAYSHHPAWTALEVHGVPANAEIEAALRAFGVNRIQKSASGFIAFRAAGGVP